MIQSTLFTEGEQDKRLGLGAEYAQPKASRTGWREGHLSGKMPPSNKYDKKKKENQKEGDNGSKSGPLMCCVPAGKYWILISSRCFSCLLKVCHLIVAYCNQNLNASTTSCTAVAAVMIKILCKLKRKKET